MSESPDQTVADALIKVRFLSTDEGGRRSPISGDYGCPVLYQGSGYDCRFWNTRGQIFVPGAEYEIEVRFLDPDIGDKIPVGAAIALWEGKLIAIGQLVRFFWLVAFAALCDGLRGTRLKE